MILPQVQAIRETLDSDALCLTVRENRVAQAISQQTVPPKFVITDSQAVEKVCAATPKTIPVTTFSIQMAYCKSDLVEMARGARHDRLFKARRQSHDLRDLLAPSAA